RNITDKELNHLVRLTDLQELTLAGPNVTDAGLINVAALKGLTDLYLYDIPLTDKSFFVINSLPNLKRLTLGHCTCVETDGKDITEAKENYKLEMVEVDTPLKLLFP